MKKIAIALCLICATSALCAPIPQASQAWVNMKLAQLRADILSEIDAGNTNGLSDTEVVANAVTRGMASAMSITHQITGISSSIYTNANPMYVISSVSPAFTNAVAMGDIFRWMEAGVYTNGTMTITESGATNTLAIGAVNLYSPTNSILRFEPSAGGGYVIASKIVKEN